MFRKTVSYNNGSGRWNYKRRYISNQIIRKGIKNAKHLLILIFTYERIILTITPHFFGTTTYFFGTTQHFFGTTKGDLIGWQRRPVLRAYV